VISAGFDRSRRQSSAVILPARSIVQPGLVRAVIGPRQRNSGRVNGCWESGTRGQLGPRGRPYVTSNALPRESLGVAGPALTPWRFDP